VWNRWDGLPSASLSNPEYLDYSERSATMAIAAAGNRRHFLSALRYGIRVETPAEFLAAVKGKRTP
jgi:hypothetical protein